MSAPFAPTAGPVLARSTDAEQLVFPGGSTMTLLADSDATGGRLSVHRSVLAAGAEGADPHHHTAVAEAIYVLGGRVQLLVGDDVVEAGEGDLVVIPPGVTHAFAALPGLGAELLVATTPGIERFSLWRRIERVAAGREPAGDLVADQSSYDTYPDASPRWDRARHAPTNQPTNTRRPAMSTAGPTSPTSPATVASEHRTMNTVIHAAFRRDLRRLGQALERCPADARARADQVAAAWDNVAWQLHVHHEDEEHLFWPAFLALGVDPGLVAELEAEHGQMVRALGGAEDAMGTFRTNPSAANVAAARMAVAELARVLDDHLAHEERDLEPFGAEHHDTPEHKAAVARARRSHTEGAGNFFAWLGDTDDPAIAAALRREVPAPVLYLLTTFGGRSYRRRAAAAWG
jgi:quercetin dioxygenase-like cupin family protein